MVDVVIVFISFFCGIVMMMIMLVLSDDSLDKKTLQDYYQVQAERMFYKYEYERIHYILEHLDDEDIEMYSRDTYNHFIIKKENEDGLSEIWKTISGD